jgi:hypothetical protein
MQATQVDGGYRVTGRSPFASNCRDATWIASTVMVMDGGQLWVRAGGATEVVVPYFPADACEIIDTWYVMGTRGTGSEDIAATDIFVPDRLTFPLVPERDPRIALPESAVSVLTHGCPRCDIPSDRSGDRAERDRRSVHAGSGENAVWFNHAAARAGYGPGEAGIGRGSAALGSRAAL